MYGAMLHDLKLRITVVTLAARTINGGSHSHSYQSAAMRESG